VTSSFSDPRGDPELLRDIAGGDPDALVVLYDRHAAWLSLRLRRRCSDEHLVDEVLQDTFLAVWRGARGFTSGQVGAWMWTIASRRLVDAVRSSGSRHRLLDRLFRHRQPSEPSAEDAVLVGLEHGDLASAVNRLAPDLRIVLQATVLDGLTTAEAARLLGIPRNTVKTRAMRARAQLRQDLA
jgi:RNA polymerase sigma-70 factor (ECF subfamily)